ncbi:hypothetical protein T07_8107 [Trichinella nelsoni]|uniref:Uncharacterized protein n=1 Tax=Trichinella nelsoni TaxID=6336 RepID=A0A0V0RJZ0_9BILA|nr:hypothetical protein T07_8107 [Trichinella nelsoni]
MHIIDTHTLTNSKNTARTILIAVLQFCTFDQIIHTIVNLRQNKPKHKVSGIILQRTKHVYGINLLLFFMRMHLTNYTVSYRNFFCSETGEIYCVSEIAALCSSCSMLLLLKLCFVLQILKKSHDH